MSFVTTKDGTEIYYKDWGSGPPIVFSHGWPLSADDWDAQMMFFLNRGYHYADDLATVTKHLDLKKTVHVGHSTGGGEVVRYLARHGENRVAKAALISAITPLMLQTTANPGGLPMNVFDELQAQVATRRSEFYRDVAAGPFYGFNRPGIKTSEAIVETGGARA
jgi:non-heme chloroperoxidase